MDRIEDKKDLKGKNERKGRNKDGFIHTGFAFAGFETPDPTPPLTFHFFPKTHIPMKCC